ncbi:MAG: methyltransferase [Akkermansiaceae bacterium]|nr:methyltransferase [Akkermansiaceae bacterium]
MAFGTGDHATTASCLRRLVDEARRWRGKRWRLLDLGCGSGILAIGGRLLGAEHCEAVDYDPKAVVVTERNLKRNRVEGVDVREANVLDWRPRGRFEIVTANLFANVLREAFPMMRACLANDGKLIVSGILADQWPSTRQAGEAAGLKFTAEWKRGKWITALARS